MKHRGISKAASDAGREFAKSEEGKKLRSKTSASRKIKKEEQEVKYKKQSEANTKEKTSVSKGSAVSKGIGKSK